MLRKLGGKLKCVVCFGKADAVKNGRDHPPQIVGIDENKKRKYRPKAINPSPSIPGNGNGEESLTQREKPHEESKRKERRNLWELAEAEMSEDERKLLNTGQTNHIAKILEIVIDNTKGKYEMYKKGSLQIRSRNGRRINIRDSAKKIMVFALQTQELIKGVASFDPIGHASAAWSIVSFGLTLIDNDIERRDAIMEAAEFLAGVLAYHAIIDNNYRRENIESNQGLEDALVEVYIAILRYTVEVKKAKGEAVWARIGKSIVALIEKPLEQLKSTIASKSETVDRWKTLNQDTDQRDKAEHIMTQVDEMTKNVEVIDSRIRSNEELQILDWLSKASYSQTQNATQDRRIDNTGNWFLNSEEYVQWTCKPGMILWLNGAVGCGKSVLSSSIIKDVEKHCADHPHKGLAYWYFQFSNQESQSVENMIRSLIRQLSPNPLPDHIHKLWVDYRQGREPSKGKLLQSLHRIIDTGPGDVFLIFDALDECPELPGFHERQSLMAILESLLESHLDRIHILATSRPEPDICAALANLESGKLRIWDHPIQRRIKKRLLDVPERRFRWADLQIKRLEGCHIEQDINQALESIPDSLEGAYRDILTRLPKKYRDAARSILIWLSFSAEPLTLKTVAQVAYFPFESSVVDICTTSLVTISAPDDTVRLAHFSVKEFLVTEVVTGTDWYRFSAAAGHRAILERSVSDLLLQEQTVTIETVLETPLLVYAAQNWEFHLSMVESLPTPEYLKLQSNINRLFTERYHYNNWMLLRYSDVVFEDCNGARCWFESPIYEASKLGLMQTVETLLDNGADPFDSIAKPPLMPRNAFTVASVEGHLDVLELLLRSSRQIPGTIALIIVESIDCRRHGREKVDLILKLLWDMVLFADKSKGLYCEDFADGLLRSATSNSLSGSLLVGISLSWEHKTMTRCTSRVLGSAINNRAFGKEILEMIFRYWGANVHITPDVMHALSVFSGCDVEKVTVIIKQWGDLLPFNEMILRHFAREANWAVMESLLLVYKHEIKVTNDILIAAAKNRIDVRMIQYFLVKRGHGTNISKSVYIAAAKNWTIGVLVMTVLLGHCGPDLFMGEEVVEAAVSRGSQGLGILKLMLQRQQAGFVVSQKALKKALLYHGKETIKILIDNGGSTVLTATQIIRCATENRHEANSLMEYFLDLYQEAFPITADILVSAAANDDISPGTFSRLLNTSKDFSVPHSVFKEALLYSPEKMSLLLDKPHDRLPTVMILDNIAFGSEEGDRVFELVLDRQLIEVDEQTIETLTFDFRTLELVLNRYPHAPITEQAFLGAVYQGKESLSVLLNAWHNDRVISQDIMDGATESFDAAGILQLLFHRLGSNVPITERTLIRVARRFSKRALEVVLKRQCPLDIQPLWEAIWQGGCCQKRSASIVIHRYADPHVSESMLERMVEYSDADFDDGYHDDRDISNVPLDVYYAYDDIGDFRFDGLVRFCAEKRIPIQSTDRVIEIILERCSKDAVRLFLCHQSDLQIEPRHLKMVMRNRREDGEVLLSLLQERM